MTPPRRLAGWARRRRGRLAVLGALLGMAAAGAGVLGWTGRDRERRRLEAEPRLQAGREALERAERLLALPEADLRPLDRYLDGAVEALGEALDRDPARPEGYALLGRALFLRERPEEAERELSRAIERVPTNPAWRLHRAEVREALARRARSAALIRGRPVPSSEEQAWRRRAVEDLREAERWSLEESDRLVAGARRALLEGDRAGALERAARGLQVDPNRWEFYFVRAVAAPPGGPETVSAWRAAWQRRPNDGTIVSEFSAALEGTRREEDLREALAHVSRLAERNPGDLQRRADRLRLLRKLLRFREALEEAEGLVRAAPEAIHPRYQRGQLYLLLDDTARGIADLERCLEVIPPEVTGWEYYNDLARAYARAGRWADAARCLEEAYRRNGDRGDRQVDANLGLTWAEAPWEEAVRQGPLRRVWDPERGLEVKVGIATARLVRALYPDPAGRGADLVSGPAFQALAVRRLYLGDFDGACSTVPERHLDPSVPAGRAGFLFRALARSCRGPRGAYEARPEDFPEALMAEGDRWAWGARLGRGLAGILWGRGEAAARDFEEALRLDPARGAETLLALSVRESARGDEGAARGLLREAAGRSAELAFLAAGP
jgi:tetratricopeptide (TPR) repeat protein